MTTLTIYPPADLINANQRAAFTVAGEPMSKARARFTSYGSKVRTYTPAKTLTGERKVRDAYLAVAKPATDPEEAFAVVVEFLHETGQRRDVDNMLKLILDGLNKIAWPDDVQVTQIHATKRRVPKGDAETRVAIYSLGRIDKPRGKCVRCGTEFAQYASTSSRKFCTRDCGYAHRKEIRERACLNCGEMFLAHGVSRDTVYCGMACTSAHKRVDLTCATCGDVFTKPRSLANKGAVVCSDDCRAAYHRGSRAQNARGTCGACGGPTAVKRSLRCRACHVAGVPIDDEAAA